jgi:hypothetical protein
LSSLSTVLVLCVRYVYVLVLLCRSLSSTLELREFFARSSRSTSARISYSSLSGTKTLIRREGKYPPPTGFSTVPYANKTSRQNMCRADICNTCRCTKFTVSEEKSRNCLITSSFVESGRISLTYCSKVSMNLRTFPSTAGDAISSSSRLILLSRRLRGRQHLVAGAYAEDNILSQAHSLRGSLVYCRSLRPSCSRRISLCGGLSCTARVFVGGSIKRAAGVTRSRWCGIILPRVHEMISSSLTGPRRSRTSAELSAVSLIDQCLSDT